MSSTMPFRVESIAGALGAEVYGVDLGEPLSGAVFDALHAAWLEHLVLFFPQQRITLEQHRDFAARLGELDIPRFSPPFRMPAVHGHPEIYQLVKEPDDVAYNNGGFWHADVTHREQPNLASVIVARESPAYGGDTMFSNLYLAYEALSSGMRMLLDNLSAIHSSEMPHGGREVRSTSVSRQHASAHKPVFAIEQVDGRLTETEHPVVRRHPESGRRCLYVNRAFTSHFTGMTIEESRPLLEFLWSHCERPEFTCRYRWKDGDVGLWDNRCVLHYALNDYHGKRRVMHRISVNEPTRPAQ